jgi:DNA-binding transcriptional LysR family regulator
LGSGATHRTAGELSGERFILRETGSGSRRTIDDASGADRIRLEIKLTVSSNEAIRDLVASGMGLAVLSRHALPPILRAKACASSTCRDSRYASHGWSSICDRRSCRCRPGLFLDELLRRPTTLSAKDRRASELP